VQHRKAPSFVAALAALALLTSGCAATLQRGSGPAIEGVLTDADATYLYIRSDSGAVYRVPRTEVSDIDHPGNVLATIGAVFLTMSVIFLADGEDYSNEAGAIYGAIGAGMTAGGLIPWMHSRLAISNEEGARTGRVDATVVPPVPLVPLGPRNPPAAPASAVPGPPPLVRPTEQPTDAPDSAPPAATPAPPAAGESAPETPEPPPVPGPPGATPPDVSLSF